MIGKLLTSHQKATSDTWMWALLVLCFCVFANALLFRGHYAIPHTNSLEIGLGGDGYSRALSDITRYFIPKLQQHLESIKEGNWIGLWDPYIQGGRPASLGGGYSPAYPITWVLSQFIGDAYVLHTWISLVTIFISASFAYLVLREIGLLPVAALAATVLFAFGSYNALWVGFVQFLSWPMWTMVLLWCCLRFLRKRDIVSWLGFAFAGYCAFIGTRHQALIQQVYFLLPLGFYWSYMLTSDWRMRVGCYIALAMALVLSMAASIPVLWDLAYKAENSVRLNKDIYHFLMQGVTAGGVDWSQFANLTMMLSFPRGLMLSSGLPPFHGFSLMPLGVLGMAMALWLRFSSPIVWMSGVVTCFFVLMTVWPDLHLFGIKYMGFHFSRAVPFGAAFIPSVLLAAVGVDAIWRKENSPARTRGIYGLAIGIMGVVGVLSLFVLQGKEWWVYVCLMGAFFIGSAMALHLRSLPCIMVVLLAGIVAVSLHGMSTVPAGKVKHTSPLIQAIHASLASGQRLARFGENQWMLHSNTEASYNIRSIHSYDSLASKDYVNLTAQISDQGTVMMGRHFKLLDNEAKLSSPLLDALAVQVILSDKPLHVEGWQEQQVGQFWLLSREPLPLAWFDGDKTALPEYHEVAMDKIHLVLPQQHHGETVVISQQYHPDWRAEDQNGEALPTTKWQDFFLAVQVNAGTEEVRLHFRPMAVWAWVPMLAFAIAFAVAGTWRLMQSRKRYDKGLDAG